jgi:hypothetical protein
MPKIIMDKDPTGAMRLKLREKRMSGAIALYKE